MTSNDNLQVDILICGAGAVGLAIAAHLSEKYTVAVVEKHPGPARETSSHNSGVIHAGIYYETDSLKHTLCQKGNTLLYEWCESHSVRADRTGKLIVAFEDSELDLLHEVYEQGIQNNVRDFTYASSSQIHELEPHLDVAAALWSPWTGVIDAFGLCRSYEQVALENGSFIAYQHELVQADRRGDHFVSSIVDSDQENTQIRSDMFINCAGLAADSIAAMVGYPLDGGYTSDGTEIPVLKQTVNRGRYYDVVDPSITKMINRPIYPLPDHQAGGLGVHLTTDTDGGLHLGPSMEWMDETEDIDYRNEPDEIWSNNFLQAGRKFLPGLTMEQLAPGQVGYRPKTQKPGESLADFLIWTHEGYTHLGGIESPGLTASLPIADYVAKRL